MEWGSDWGGREWAGLSHHVFFSNFVPALITHLQSVYVHYTKYMYMFSTCTCTYILS